VVEKIGGDYSKALKLASLGRRPSKERIGQVHDLYEWRWGLSTYEPRPSYQGLLPSATHRLVPDVSSDANPNTGVWVYDNNPTNGCCWYVFGGTSVASPNWAGIVNAAGHFAASSTADLTTIYAAYASSTNYPADYNDITYGLCSFYDGNIAVVKWDPCTGVGSPKGYVRK